MPSLKYFLRRRKPIGGSKKRYSARSGRDPAVNEKIHWRDHHTFYFTVNSIKEVYYERGVL